MPPCPTLPSLPPVSLARRWVPRRHRPDPRRAARIPTGSPAAGSIPRAAAALRTELRGRPGAGTGAEEGPGWAARGAPGSRHGGGRDRGPGPGRALTHPRRDLVDGVPAGVPPRLRHRVEAGQLPAVLPRAQHAANPPPPPQRHCHCRRRRAGPGPDPGGSGAQERPAPPGRCRRGLARPAPPRRRRAGLPGCFRGGLAAEARRRQAPQAAGSVGSSPSLLHRLQLPVLGIPGSEQAVWMGLKACVAWTRPRCHGQVIQAEPRGSRVLLKASCEGPQPPSNTGAPRHLRICHKTFC